MMHIFHCWHVIAVEQRMVATGHGKRVPGVDRRETKILTRQCCKCGKTRDRALRTHEDFMDAKTWGIEAKRRQGGAA